MRDVLATPTASADSAKRAYSLRVQATIVGFRRDTSAAASRGTPTKIGATISTSEGTPEALLRRNRQPIVDLRHAWCGPRRAFRFPPLGP